MRTLKDIEQECPFQFRIIEGTNKLEILEPEKFMQIKGELIKSSSLRQAAIAWVKWFDKHRNYETCFDESVSSDAMYAAAASPTEVLKHNVQNAKELMAARIANSKWIKHFFNITEEDLK